MLYAWPHHKDGAGNVVTIGEIMLGDDRSGFFMVGMGVRIFFFKRAERLDAVVGDNDYVSVVVDVLEDGAEHSVKGDVLIGKSALANAVDAGVVADVERRDGIEPMAGAIFAGLGQEGEVGGVGGQQIVEELGLLVANCLHFGQPLVDNFAFVLLEIAGGVHALAVDIEIADILQQFFAHLSGINRIAAGYFADLVRAEDAVFTVLAAGAHATDHVAVDG